MIPTIPLWVYMFGSVVVAYFSIGVYDNNHPGKVKKFLTAKNSALIIGGGALLIGLFLSIEFAAGYVLGMLAFVLNARKWD